MYDQVHDVDDPTGLAPVVKKAGCCGATPLFQRLPPPASTPGIHNQSVTTS
jgi:hypothetical protein